YIPPLSAGTPLPPEPEHAGTARCLLSSATRTACAGQSPVLSAAPDRRAPSASECRSGLGAKYRCGTPDRENPWRDARPARGRYATAARSDYAASLSGGSSPSPLHAPSTARWLMSHASSTPYIINK